MQNENSNKNVLPIVLITAGIAGIGIMIYMLMKKDSDPMTTFLTADGKKVTLPVSKVKTLVSAGRLSFGTNSEGKTVIRASQPINLGNGIVIPAGVSITTSDIVDAAKNAWDDISKLWTKEPAKPKSGYVIALPNNLSANPKIDVVDMIRR